MATKSSSWAAKAWAVLAKDIRSEFRTRYAINAIALFAVTTLTAVSFAVGGVGVGANILAALLWVIIYFSAMSGLSRTFVREEESGTAVALRLAAPPNAVYLGKFGFNMVLLLGLEIVIVPMFIVMMDMHVRSWGLFLAVVLVGSLGMSAAATMLAAIVSKANAKGALFAVLSFPILLPLLVVGIHGTRAALEQGAFRPGAGDVRLLVAYAGIMVTLSLMLFRFVWEE